jgi:uroporphyrin-III C-methyltransferase
MAPMSDPTPATEISNLPAPIARPPARRTGNVLAVLVALLALGGAGYALWRVLDLDDSRGNVAATDAQVAVLMHTLEQMRASSDALRARMDDGDKVNKSAREELLSLSERARLLEDAVANLADKRLSGHDALLLNESELLLTLGAERYTLFHDRAAASAAYRLADTTLSQVEDAAFSSVRQSVDAEIAALDALQTADPQQVSAQLAQLRTQIVVLPAPAQIRAAEAPAAPPSRLWRILGAFVQVHHGDDTRTLLALRDVGLARELAALDLRDAQVALLARDQARYRAALAAARAQITAFDPAVPEVAAVLAQLDSLDKAVLAPAPPELLGAALKELRNLRATHALHAPAPPAATAGRTPP